MIECQYNTTRIAMKNYLQKSEASENKKCLFFKPQGIGDYAASALLKRVRGMLIQLHPLRLAAAAHLPTAEYRFGFLTYLVISKNDAKTSLRFAGIVKILLLRLCS